jgi:hypothetical protein
MYFHALWKPYSSLVQTIPPVIYCCCIDNDYIVDNIQNNVIMLNLPASSSVTFGRHI